MRAVGMRAQPARAEHHSQPYSACTRPPGCRPWPRRRSVHQAGCWRRLRERHGGGCRGAPHLHGCQASRLSFEQQRRQQQRAARRRSAAARARPQAETPLDSSLLVVWIAFTFNRGCTRPPGRPAGRREPPGYSEPAPARSQGPVPGHIRTVTPPGELWLRSHGASLRLGAGCWPSGAAVLTGRPASAAHEHRPIRLSQPLSCR